jgi:hypothetical protein
MENVFSSLSLRLDDLKHQMSSLVTINQLKSILEDYLAPNSTPTQEIDANLTQEIANRPEIAFKRSSGWKEHLKQWHEGDNFQGPVKYWPITKRKEKKNKTFYHQRKAIADEVERLGGEEAFEREYSVFFPDYAVKKFMPINELLKFIRERNKL